MLGVIALMPDGAPQYLARTPKLAFPADYLAHAFEIRQQGNEMVPDHLQAFERIGGDLLLVFREWIADPFLIPPFRAADVLEDAADRPALFRVGLRELLG